MSGGQLLVFWCVIAGLVIDTLVEYFRWRDRGPTIGRTSHDRLMDELHRHKDER